MACGTIVATIVLAAPAAAQAVGPYVALGDSYTSAPFVLYPTGNPIGCGRSTTTTRISSPRRSSLAHSPT